jgi:hypothetical protein
MATGLPAVGAKLQRGTATGASLPAPGSDTFTDVPLINNLKPPAAKRKLTDFYTLESASPKRYGGALDPQEVTFDMVVDVSDAVQRTIITDGENASQVRRNWRIIYPNTAAEQLDFVGFVSGYEEEALEAEGIVQAKITITIDGAVTRTP